MMTTPRRNDAGDPSNDRAQHGASARGRSNWSTGRAVSHRRVDEIKRRITSGAYDTPQVIDALARRLIDSSEL
jgi:anti-sigma28 factor (negative regulator of flagellin synthesis)